jgi:chaperonin GroES|tara:strand:+ start:250 stop:546 length:297 start_codon:yes stop_codon:yes gene_type:complete
MLKPFDARVVVKKPKREEKTESGIFLPDNVNEQGQTAIGEVVAVGPGSRNMMSGEVMPLGIEVGDKLIYMKMGAYEVKHNNQEYFVITEREIVAVVED